MKLKLSVVCAVLTGVSLAYADNWPQWRGPEGNGTAADGDYPVQVSPAQNAAWSAKLPGRGSSTPAVWGDHIVLTCGVGEDAKGQDGVLCFDRKGTLLWQRELGPQRPGKHRNGSGSNSSVVIDEQGIYAYFKSGAVAGLDFDGTVRWTINLQEKYGQDSLWWDLATSPVLAGGNVVVAVMHEGNSYVVALNAATGEAIWKVDRNFECQQESHQSYTTPTVLKDQIVIMGADHLTGHDIKTGARLWTEGGLNPKNEAYWRVIASQSVADGVAVVPFGRGGSLAGIRVVGSDGMPAAKTLWTRHDIGSDVPTPVTTKGRVYHVCDKGTVSCLDLNTGHSLWTQSLPKGAGKFYSSPVLAGNRLYFCNEEGMLYVAEVSEAGFKLLSQNDLGDRVAASPVLVDGLLLMRTAGHLYCFRR